MFGSDGSEQLVEEKHEGKRKKYTKDGAEFHVDIKRMVCDR